MKLLRNILIPIVPFYYIITWLRNKLYDFNFIQSKGYDIPIICIGNLSVGGTGKTPMIEYLIRLLKNKHKIATLSRGYKRQSQGFQIADHSTTVQTIGDEPFQIYSKFNDIVVSVDSNRRSGISNLSELSNAPKIILLDDAFQHRRVKAGLNILLTSFDNLYIDDILLPTGNLREARSGANRADIIMVTKCPEDLEEHKKNNLRNRLNIKSYQKLFFSSIVYSDLIYSIEENHPISFLNKEKFTLVTGIANANPLVNYLSSNGFAFEHLNFKDHHNFTKNELSSINSKNLVLTTEKDFMRLKDALKSDKLYYLPIETRISESSQFDQIIRRFIEF